MSKIPIIYIAGPFRGKTAWQITQNINRAELIASWVAISGAMPLCPHTNTRNFDGIQDDNFWLKGTLELMRRCDGVIVAPYYKKSIGTLGEIEEAKQLDKPILYIHEDWLIHDVFGNGPHNREIAINNFIKHIKETSNG